MADGKERFKKTNERRAAILAAADDDGVGWEGGNGDEEANRLDEFGSWLEDQS